METGLSETTNMDTIAARLRGEMAESFRDLFNEGKEDGRRWAKSAHYDEIQTALAWYPGFDRIFDIEDEALVDYFRDAIDETEHLGFENHTEEMDDRTLEWAKGWKEGVEQFWNEVEGMPYVSGDQGKGGNDRGRFTGLTTYTGDRSEFLL